MIKIKDVCSNITLISDHNDLKDFMVIEDNKNRVIIKMHYLRAGEKATKSLYVPVKEFMDDIMSWDVERDMALDYSKGYGYPDDDGRVCKRLKEREEEREEEAQEELYMPIDPKVEETKRKVDKFLRGLEE